MTIFDEAQRYLDLRASGWRDPEVDPHELIAQLVAERDAIAEGMISDEAHDEAITDLKREHETELDTLRDEQKTAIDALRDEHKIERLALLDPETVTVAECLTLLKSAIEREQAAAVQRTRAEMTRTPVIAMPSPESPKTRRNRRKES